MEACEEFSENMELHADDVEYFYIESKRVTERREKEKRCRKEKNRQDKYCNDFHFISKIILHCGHRHIQV